MPNAPFVTILVGAMSGSGAGGRRRLAEPFIAKQTWEKWMKLAKTSAIALAMSTILAGPVLAQGASSGTQIRGGAQGKANMQGGMTGGGDTDLNAQQSAPGEKAGVNAKGSARGTVGSATGATKGTGGAMSDPTATGKRY
jgi:hypothetical protein